MSFNFESVAIGYMIGLNEGSDNNVKSSSTIGVISLGFVFIIIFDFLILYFFGDAIFDLCGFSFFMQDEVSENFKQIPPIVEVSNKLMRAVLPIIPIYATTLFLLCVYKLYQYKKEGGF